MTERERGEPPYWQEDVAIGEAPVQGERYTVRLRLHTAVERVRNGRSEIVPLSPETRERTYVHARPYILIPDISLTVGLYPFATKEGAVGRVVDSEWTGMRHLEIGNAQAWCYPLDNLTVIWECFADAPYQAEDPRRDELLATLWTGFEAQLTQRFPSTRSLVTTWEDIYERDAWQTFLEAQGYQKTAPAVFLKALG